MRMFPLAAMACAVMTASCGSGGGSPSPDPTKPAASSAAAVSSNGAASSLSSESVSSLSVPASSSQSVASSASSASIGEQNLLGSDGSFAAGQGEFAGTVDVATDASFSWAGEVAVAVNSTSAMTWHVQLTHPVAIEQGVEYSLCFRAKAAANRSIQVDIDQGGEPGYDSVMDIGSQTAQLTTSYEAFHYVFAGVEDDATARLTMNFGVPEGDAPVSVQVDDIGVYLGNTCGNPANVPASEGGNGSRFIVGTPPITTDGNRVLFGGKRGSIAGMSLFWSNYVGDGGKFYTQGVVETLKTQWHAKLVRAAMGVNAAGGYLAKPADNLARVTTIVDAAIANDMYVIIDWHTHDAEDYQQQAIAFFKEMATTYGTYPNVIYEVYNEPDCPTKLVGDCNWSTKTKWADIKAYAEPVIAAIRDIDPDNLIIVGTPFYSQFVDDASLNPIEDNNVAYTLHFYADSHQTTELNRAKVALRNGIPLFVTEWGTVGASGNGNFNEAWSDTWMQFLLDNDISHANWSISDKAEAASILKPGSNGANGWSDSDLTATGRYVKNKIMNW